jgi:hypothetical protein
MAVEQVENSEEKAEETVRKLLKALWAADPSWALATYSVRANPLDPRSRPLETLSLCQGGRRFCRGFDAAGLLLDFVECCRDKWYSSGCGWRIPGALRGAADPDDLAFRLEVLT